VETAQPYLIREAVSALVEVVLGRKLLVWGGHPAITPMIWAAATSLGIEYGKCVRLFQSRFFEEEYPDDNRRFQNVTYTNAVPNDQNASLSIMRERMLGSYRYDAAVFIGGMEGIELEFDIFRRLNPDAAVFPVPSPGGVARELFDRVGLPEELRSAFDFSARFYHFLKVKTTDPRQSDNLDAAARR
jgi:hypothetical protein